MELRRTGWAISTPGSRVSGPRSCSGPGIGEVDLDLGRQRADAAGVVEALTAEVRSLPEALRRSLTWDHAFDLDQQDEAL